MRPTRPIIGPNGTIIGMARVDGRILAEPMHNRFFWLTGLLVIATLIVAVLLIVAGFELLRSAGVRIFDPTVEKANISWLVGLVRRKGQCGRITRIGS